MKKITLTFGSRVLAVIDGLEVVVFQPRFYSLSDNGVILLSDEVVV